MSTIAEIRKDSKAEGRNEMAKEKDHEYALKMLRRGMDISLIEDLTNLSSTQIEELKKDLK